MDSTEIYAKWVKSGEHRKLSQLEEIFEQCEGNSVQLVIFKGLTLKEQRHMWAKLEKSTKNSLWFLMEPSFRWYMLLDVILELKTADAIWASRKTFRSILSETYDLNEVLSMIK